jgi:hypothetical protein
VIASSLLAEVNDFHDKFVSHAGMTMALAVESQLHSGSASDVKNGA